MKLHQLERLSIFERVIMTVTWLTLCSDGFCEHADERFGSASVEVL
jgi:hypothetical protein